MILKLLTLVQIPTQDPLRKGWVMPVHTSNRLADPFMKTFKQNPGATFSVGASAHT